MELTNQQVQDAIVVLRHLGQQKFTAKFAWKLQTARKQLEPYLETLVEAIQAIQQKYGDKDEAGALISAKDEAGNPVPGSVNIPEDKLAEANLELTELLKETVTVENVKLRIQDFPDSVEIAPDTLAALAPIMD